MSLTEILIKVIGIVLAVVGVLLLLSVVGITTVVAVPNIWIALIAGFAFLAVGIYIVRGGSITL